MKAHMGFFFEGFYLEKGNVMDKFFNSINVRNYST